MPWVKKKKSHECRKPQIHGLIPKKGIGSIWKCPRCHAKWRVISYIRNNYRNAIAYEWVRYY